MTRLGASAWSLWLSVALLLLISACQSEPSTTSAPEDLISEEHFVELIVELNLIEAIKSVSIRKDAKKPPPPEAFYEQAWAKHGVTEKRFLSSFEYYRSDISRMSKIYEQAAARIKRMEDLNNEAKREQSKETNQAAE